MECYNNQRQNFIKQILFEKQEEIMGYKRSVHRTFALITQVGISMIVPILLCTWIGSYLEKKFSFPLFIPLVILGVLAGFRNTYYLVKDANEDPKEEEDE